MSNFDENVEFWQECVKLIFHLFQEARMAAKLLEKKFGIKDVSSDNFQDFYQCYHFWSQVVDFILIFTIYFRVQVVHWMKSTDTDNDGKLSYKEFNRSLKEFLKITADDNEEEEK